MKTTPHLAIFALALPVVALCQVVLPPNDAAAAALNAITRLLTLQPDMSNDVSRLQLVATQAGAFQAAYPTHARASDARKLELIAGIQLLQLGMPDAGNYLSRAKAFRTDRRVGVSDRHEMALAMENLAQSADPDSQADARSLVAQESLADRLLVEFGPTAEVLGQYAGLIMKSDASDALRLAEKLQRLDVPVAFKREARGLAERNQRAGRDIELTMNTADGDTIVFEELSAPTVVYFWDSAQPDHLALLSRFKSEVPSTIQWIYIAVGSAQWEQKTLGGSTVFPGKHCLDSSGFTGAAAATLGATEVPYVALIGRNGRLVGAGRVDELPNLLGRAIR